MLGICLEEQAEGSYRYKEISEVLDGSAVIPADLIHLAKWMAGYYHTSIGKALFAMIPAKLQISIDASVSWINLEQDIPDEYRLIYEAQKDEGKIKLQDLKKMYPRQAIYKIAEAAENAGFIKTERRLKRKDKPKIQNFIRILDRELSADQLPLKQREAWLLIQSFEQSFPMAEISSEISYSSIKALVKKGYISIFPKEIANNQLIREAPGSAKNICLNEAQERAISEILEDYGKFQVHLLYGITGSGKTEIYIELIRKYLKHGKSVIFLIPEIALTPQMLDRFDSSFGDDLAILHSQLSDAQRFNEWQKLQKGECRIALGARSAIFAPINNLGLIIVDEEHEQSYKQDNLPRYNGRDLAIVRGSQIGAQVILGSATPSLESWRNAEQGKYRLHRLLKRPLHYSLPEVKILDMRDCESRDLISDELASAIARRLDDNEQVILFQNRRGYSSFVQCLKCGKLITCPNCEISMYYHRDREEMQCHYCGLFFPIPRRCPDCGSFSFAYGAPGTQKVEQNLKILFPMAKILRLDSDSSRTNLKSMYKRMKNHEVDILLGTQMITKGLDFPNVTLVGIINADISLNIPDFRSAERSFQLITQVAGRSGRADKNGEVIIQTYNPEHYAIQYAGKQDFEGFALSELEFRKRLFYPPYSRLGRILYQSTDQESLKQEMLLLQEKLPTQSSSMIILGPSPAPFSKINHLYRYHVIIKAKTPKILNSAIERILKDTKSKLQPQIDVDPVMLL
jgi:primosomal protein N' (replication factor Y)